MLNTCRTRGTPKVQGSSPSDNPPSTASPPQLAAFSKRSHHGSVAPASVVRRDLVGGRRGQGLRNRRRVRRPDARRVVLGPHDPSLSSFGGLVAFNALIEESGVAQVLRSVCAPLKTGRSVVYPMETQVRLLLDLFVVGGTRLFDLEYLASDPLFVHLAGGRLCCLDTLYSDVQRVDDSARDKLATLLAEQGLAALRGRLLTRLHVDVDTSVCPVFGDGIEGAVPGYNPQYHGRNSYHPMLARIAESGTLLGAQLRPGNTTLGKDDVDQLDRWLTALDSFLGDSPCLVTVRIDKGGDCAALFKVIVKHRRRFVVKARLTEDLVGEILAQAQWVTTERDADDTVLTQVAEIDFVRGEWREQKLPPLRVIAVRSRERQGGKKVDDSALTLQAFFSNDFDSEAEDVVLQYDERAGIEPLLAELKREWGLEKVSSRDFGANAALLLLKGLAMNLLRRLARQQAPTVAQRWRTYGLRRLLILRPARIVRTGRRVVVRLGGLPVNVKRE